MEATFLIDEDTILERVDEYTLYCHYLEFEPDIRMNYPSPIRSDDDNPSFAIFPIEGAKREFLWKDSGGRGEKGDIFKLVQLLYGYKYRAEAVSKVKSDFGLSGCECRGEKIVRHTARLRESSDIRVRPRKFRKEDLEWWSMWNVDQELLKLYRVSSLYCYWLNPTQKVPVFTAGLSFVYRIYDRYQLYFPERPKGKKFRMDLQEEHILGLQQLKFNSDLLIITKSMKDVMCLRSFGYEAVSPRSENTPLPGGAIDWFNQRYKRILVLFDNDMKHRGEWYPYPKIYVPPESGSKDISDFTRDSGPVASRELLSQITNL